MKLIKIYLIVVTVLLILGLGFGVYVWYTIQTLGSQTDEMPEQKNGITSQEVTPGETNREPIIIKTADLPESQQEILKDFGLNSDVFTITPAMVSCAENAVGKIRLDEILKGAAPTPFESIKLLPCFK